MSVNREFVVWLALVVVTAVAFTFAGYHRGQQSRPRPVLFPTHGDCELQLLAHPNRWKFTCSK